MAQVMHDYCWDHRKTSLEHVYFVDIRPEMITSIQLALQQQGNMTKSATFCGQNPAKIKLSDGAKKSLQSASIHSRGNDKPNNSLPKDSFHSAAGSRRPGSPKHQTMSRDSSGFPESSILSIKHSVGVKDPIHPTYAAVTSHGTRSVEMRTTIKEPSQKRPVSVPVTSHSLSHMPVKDSASKPKDEDCPICMCPVDDPETLSKCKHTFCKDCIKECFQKTKPVCPVCATVYGKITGNQPKDGTMRNSTYYSDLPGYTGCGNICIIYSFPSGVQTVSIFKY